MSGAAGHGGTEAARAPWPLLGALALGLAVSITLAQTVLALLALRWLWRLGTGRARPGWPLAAPVLAFVAATLLAALVAPRPLDGLAAARGVLLIAAFYVLRDALPDAGAADRFLGWLLALGGFLGVLAALQVGLCPWLEAGAPWLGRLARKCHRAHAFFSIWMTLAGVLSLVLLATLPRHLLGNLDGAAHRRGWRGRWPAAGWLLAGVGLALTYVRGAWLGFLVGVAVLLGLVRRGRWLVVGAVAALALGVALTPPLRQRAESIVDPSDPTARERWTMWRAALAMARAHPLTGVGPGGVSRVYARYAEPGARVRGHVHNTPLQILAESGAVGLGAWLALFVTFFWRAAQVLRALPLEDARGRALVAGSIAAIAGFLVGGLTEHNFGDSEVVMVAYVVMAVPFVVAGAPAPAGGARPARSGRSGTGPCGTEPATSRS